jgi:ribonucleoside-diphosphate reductase alpha chain
MSQSMYVVKRDGTREQVDFGKCQKRIEKLATDMKPALNVNSIEIGQQIIIQISDGIETSKLDELAGSICANKESIHPDYGRLATRIIISNHHKNTSPSFSEVIQSLWNNKNVSGEPAPLVAKYFYDLVMKNREKLNTVIDYQKDYNYSYFGFKTLERAYLMRINDKIVERPQQMLMRVSLAIHRDDIKEAIKCYKMMSDGLFTHATPTLFNMGTPREQASSCFLININADSISGIYKTIADCAQISKYAGGIGVSVHKIRSKDSIIYGTNGRSDGIVPMLRVFNETARYVNQSGKRNGSFAMYLEPWHADIVDFLMLRRNNGTEFNRARDLFYALWVPDLFMRRVEEDGEWTLMCPNICPGLNETFGDEFDTLYTNYETTGKGLKTMRARELWNIILDSQIETGTPYICYKDAVNKKNNQANLGVIQSSNLCAEIVEFTSPDEIAVCNLASISLPKFVERTVVDTVDGSSVVATFDFKRLEDVARMLTRNLNKIIDYNFYPVPEAERSNRRHRPIGIGCQGLADVFAMMRMAFDSPAAAELNKRIFAHIYYASIEASVEIARKRKTALQEYKKLLTQKEKEPLTAEETARCETLRTEYFIIEEEMKLPRNVAGAYSSFVGSPASNGKLQYDLWGVDPLPDLAPRFEKLKEDIKKHGMRNSLCVAIMPTASTSQILGNNECCEPYTSNIYKRRTLAGEFKIINQHLMNDLIEGKLWSQDLKDKIIINGGSIQNILEIPESIRVLYKTVWEISQKAIIDMAADRGAYVCQTQSMNLFVSNATYPKLTSMHFYGWKRGLKTGIYYLRSQAVAQAQQFSIDASKTVIKTNLSSSTTTSSIINENKDEDEQPVLVCRRDNPDCMMCSG